MMSVAPAGGNRQERWPTREPIKLLLCSILVLTGPTDLFDGSKQLVSGAKNVSLPRSYQASKSHQHQLAVRQDGRQLQQTGDDYRVPFWNIAHMINSVDQIEPALAEGANGIEVDVSFANDGTPLEAYHGFPCDCGRHCHHRSNLKEFVKQVARLSNHSSSVSQDLVLIVFDLKLKELVEERQKRNAGRQLAKLLDQHLYSGLWPTGNHRSRPDWRQPQQLLQRPPVRVIVSINHVHDEPLIRAFVDYMRDNRLDRMAHLVGFDVGMNDELQAVSAMWDRLATVTNNIWQGDGLTNCANLVRGIDRLKSALEIRNGQGHFRKVYYWTVDIMYHIRSVLRLGLDAVLTNQPRRVLQTLSEPEFSSKYRLAVAQDDPFAQFVIKPSAWQMSPPTLGEAVETVADIRRTSVNFVRSLPDGIGAALRQVQHSLG